MKAAQIRSYGEDAVEINDKAEVPLLSEGEVLVEVYASGVNPIDWKIREGYMQKFVQLEFPATLGGDFSGIVAEVSPNATDFKKGDAVYGSSIILGHGSGSFAEFTSVKAVNIALKPGISHIEAASLPLAGISALQALTEHLNVSKEDRILIHGGAGGIGTFAIQIAKNLGAYVATTASGNNKNYVKELGADEFIDYKSQKFEELFRDYDYVFDTIGGETYRKSFKVLKKNGVIVSMLEQPDEKLMKQYEVNAIAQQTEINSSRLVKLRELADKGIIKTRIDKIFSLDKSADALLYLQKGHPRGKVVVKIK